MKVNHSCNVYGITIEQFGEIIDFIDNQIISYIHVLKNDNQLMSFIDESIKERRYYLERSDLSEYIELTFLDEKEELLAALNKKFEKQCETDRVDTSIQF